MAEKLKPKSVQVDAETHALLQKLADLSDRSMRSWLAVKAREEAKKAGIAK